MTDNSPFEPHVPSDVELLVTWSTQALEMGRLELAEAVVRLAIQANRLEKHAAAPSAGPAIAHVPFVGQTRIERPRLRVAAPAGPTGNGDADLAREAIRAAQASPATTSILDTGQTMPGIDRRCVEKVLQGNVYAPCHAAAYWVAPGGGLDGFWRHVDTELDNDHVVNVPE